MTTNIDLLRLYYEYEDTLDSWGRQVLLSAAMPGVPDVKSAWAEVEHLVALLDGLDPRSAAVSCGRALTAATISAASAADVS